MSKTIFRAESTVFKKDPEYMYFTIEKISIFEPQNQ